MKALHRKPPVVPALLFLILFTPPSKAQTGAWGPDERVLITDFGMVQALARSTDALFGATTGGLVVWNELHERWEPPITLEDGYPPEPVTAMAYDSRDGSLWLAAGDELHQLDPFTRRFRDRIRIGGSVGELVPAKPASNELFLRMRGEWWRVDPFSRNLHRADPAAVRQAVEARSDLRTRRESLQDPFFREGIELAARGADGRRLVVTDVVPSNRAYGWWLGTAGGFVLAYDHVSREGRRIAFGPVGRGMSAVDRTGEGMWFAPASAFEGRYGLARATPDLQSWHVWRADSARSAPFRIRAMVSNGSGVWAGGEEGLHWLARGEIEWRLEPGIDPARLPVLSLAPASGGGVWVGTSRGLLRVPSPATGADVSVLPAEPILAVVEATGSVWLGTTRGLLILALPRGSEAMPASASRAPGPSPLRLPTGAVAATGDTLFAGLGREAWWKPGRDARWTRVDAVGRLGSPVTALAVQDGVLWVGSGSELAVWDIEQGGRMRYAFGSDLPADPVGRTGIADIEPLSRREAWLALPAGALRIELRF